MEQIANYVGNIFSNEGMRTRVSTFCYILFAGLFQLSKSNLSWWISIIVGVLAGANYIDQILQRRKKNKK